MAEAAIDISDLPAPPPVDISDLPPPPTVNPTNGQPYSAYERDLYAQHPELAPGWTPPEGVAKRTLNTLGDVAAGVNAGAVDVVGTPMDLATNAVNLGKAGVEAGMLGAGYTPPTWLDPDKTENVVGTSDYLKGKIRAAGGGKFIDPVDADSNPDASALHFAGETIGPGGVAGEAARIPATLREGRAALAVAEAPRSTPKPAASGGFKAEDLADKPTEAPAPGKGSAKVDVAPEASAAPVPSDKPTEPIRGTPDADGAHQYTQEQRAQVTERAWKRVGVAVDATTGEPRIVDPEAYAQARAAYKAHPDTEGGKVLSTDTARDLSGDYNDSKEARSALAADVHEPSSTFIKQLYADKLAEAPKEGEEPRILFTAGGTGSGKTTAIANNPAMKAMRDRAQIVYDTNMNKLESATTKIDQATAAGKDVDHAYVWREPQEALAAGALPRAERQGRTVPLEEHAKTHAGAYTTTAELRRVYQNDPRVNFATLDNSRGKGNAAVVPFQALQNKRYNVPVAELRPIVESQRKSGAISPRVYNGTLGVENVPAKVGPPTGAETLPGASRAGGSIPQERSEGNSGNGQKPAGQNRGEAQSLEHPIEFLPPEAEGTKTAAVPSAEQESRADTLRALGLKEVRESALSGDYKETGTDFQTSKLDHSGGKRMNSVMENERQALRDYSEGLVDRSGGTAGTDSVERRMRGKTISAPIEAYDAALQAETKRLYKVADQRAAGTAIELKGVGNILTNEKAQFLGTSEGKQLLEGVTARAKELGLLGSNETFNPATVEQAERLRQYLNDNYTPRAGKLIAKLKDAIDEDVTKAAGADIYAAGRRVRAARSTNLEEPEGVSKLLAPEDRLGINRDVAHEDIPKYVTSLEADQFDHVVRVLKEAGRNPAIAPKSAAALNEIRSTFANAVQDAGESTQGMWNAKSVNKYLRDNRARMEQVFSPAEMAEYKTLNDGGRILRMDRTYPGAAAQGHNFIVNGVLKGAEHGATAVGGVMGHIPGAIAGHAISKGAKAIDQRAMGAAVEKRIRAL